MKTFLIAVFLGFCHLMYSQNIGVQVNVNLLPPYTLSLHDYTQSGSNKLLVSVLLKDLNYPSYQAKLRITIEGNGFTLTTRANYIPPAINLQGGIPVVLTPEDLQPYFLPENMDFNGLNKSEYLRTRKLPEGFYRFFIEVLDYNRSSLVSNKGMAMAYIVLNEPPVINLPANNSKLPANDPQNIFFNWTPRHLGSPNSAFTTLYEFRLYEIQPKGRNPYEAVRTQNPIYEAIPALTATSFNYNVGMPALIPGNQYAFTIRAIDRENRDLFKNNGYSEVYVFTWGDECKPPLKIAAEAVSGGGIDLKWKTEPAHTGYNIQYRIKGNGSWLTQNSFIENASIYELPGNSEIEYQLQSVCGGYLSEYSPIQTIRTRKEEKRAFACGSGKTMPQITNTHPKPTLKIGDQFTAGGYTASITKISGQNGVFTGECHVLVPFFNLARVPHKFENIKINELNQMYEGKLVSIYNPNSKFLARVEGVTTPDGEKEYVMATGLGKISVDSTISVKGEITSVQVNTSGELVIVSEDGETTVITPKEGEKTLVTDEKGNQYLAENGSVTQVTNAGGTQGSSIPDNMTQLVNNPDSVKKTLPLLRFAPATQMVYGFDSLKYAELNKQYITQVIRGQNYAIPFKAVATGSIDYVDILLPPLNTYDPSKVRYTMNNVPVMNSPSTGKNKRTLNVTSLSTGDIQPLDATYTLKDSTGKTNTETLGKLNVIAYNKVVKKVYLVPLNQTSSLNAVTVKSALNKIYAQAVIELDVTMQEPFFNDAWNINNDNIFDDTDTDDHMNYTPAMRALKNAFKKEKSPEKDAIYIFLIHAPHKSSLAGYMPFNAQFGFVFTQGVSNDAITHTIAHELGHGAFKLRHTFSDKNTYVLSQNTTENLMDYMGGTELNKYQWDKVHNRDWGLNWLEDEEEGEHIDINSIKSFEGLSQISFSKALITCLSPSGKIITLSDNLEYLSFTGSNQNVLPNGALTSFKNSKGYYCGIFNSVSKTFLGYVKMYDKTKTGLEKFKNPKGQFEYYEDKYSENLSNETDIYLGFRQNCQISLIKIKNSQLSGSNSSLDKIIPLDDLFNRYYEKYKSAEEIVKDEHACLGKSASEFYYGWKGVAPISEEELHQIALLINEVGEDFYKDYYNFSKQSKAYDSELWGTSGADFLVFKSALQNFVTDKKKIEDLILSESDNRKIMAYAELLIHGQYSSSISYEVRVKILKTAAKFSFLEFNAKHFDYYIVKTIQDIPNKEEAVKLVREIKQGNILPKLYSNITDASTNYFSQFIMLITTYARLDTELIPYPEKIFLWDDRFLSAENSYSFNFDESGAIIVEAYTSKWFPVYTKTILFKKTYPDPFTLVNVRYAQESTRFLPKYSKPHETAAFVPLLYLMALRSKQMTEVKMKAINITITVGSMCIGVGEIAAASKLMKVIKAIDLVVSATDIAITMNETAIHNLQGGDEFIEKWTIFSIAAGIGNFGAEKLAENAAANTEDIIKGVVEKWAELKKAHKNNPEKLIEAVGVNEFKKIEEITNNAVTEMEAAEITLDNAEDLNEIYAKALIENAGYAGESLTTLEILKSRLSDNISEFLVKFEQLGSLKVSNSDEILLIVKNSGSEETIGKIVKSKLTVTKQLDQGTVVAEAEGYQLVKNGESYGFRSLAKTGGTKINPKNIRAVAQEWNQTRKARFDLADDFYKKVGYSDYDNHLRGIDFEKEVKNITIEKGEYVYQYCKIDVNGNLETGSYFYKSKDININKLGFDIEGRVMVRAKLEEGSEFLLSTAADIEDWMPGSTKIFQGGEIQLFNPNAKLKDITILK